jgi:cellobiose phosphorylase
MYRVGLETILGFTRQGSTLTIEPCVPQSWREYSIEYRHDTALYAIRVVRNGTGGEVRRVTVDGLERTDGAIPLVDDGKRHDVIVYFG